MLIFSYLNKKKIFGNFVFGNELATLVMTY